MDKELFISRLAAYTPRAHELIDGEASQTAMLRRILWDTIDTLRTTLDGILLDEGTDIFLPIIDAFKPLEDVKLEGVRTFRVQCCLNIATILQAQDTQVQPALQSIYVEPESLGHHPDTQARPHFTEVS